MRPSAPACLLWHLPCQLAGLRGRPAALPRCSPEPGAPLPSLTLAARWERGRPCGYLLLRKGRCRCSAAGAWEPPGNIDRLCLAPKKEAETCQEAAARAGCPDTGPGLAASPSCAAAGTLCSPGLA